MSASPEGRSYLPPEEPPTRECELATASLLAGIMSWVVFPLISAVIAVVIGHKARIEIARSGGKLTGDAKAVAGLWLGYANIALIALIGICAASFFLLLPVVERFSTQ